MKKLHIVNMKFQLLTSQKFLITKEANMMALFFRLFPNLI